MVQQEEEWTSKRTEKDGEIRGLERQLEEAERDREAARDRLQEVRWLYSFSRTSMYAVCRSVGSSNRYL